MSNEIWILLMIAVSGVAAALGYLLARHRAPSKADLETLTEELAQARAQAEGVQTEVNDHFEQSAVLFGKLAKDYRDFLEHFSSSAQALGLSESRARELLEQGYQPLLTDEGFTHEQAVVEPPAGSEEALASADVVGAAEAAEAQLSATLAEQTTTESAPVPEPQSTRTAAHGATHGAEPESTGDPLNERSVAATPDPETESAPEPSVVKEVILDPAADGSVTGEDSADADTSMDEQAGRVRATP